VKKPYFAYGSNLDEERLLARVPGARALGRARLDGFGLRTNKPGRDGSAKANLVLAAGEVTWGVLYAIELDAYEQLDRFEGGYVRRRVVVETDTDVRAALTYVSERRTLELTVTAAYRAHMVRGARAHGLPEDWVRRLAALPSRGDQSSGG